MKNLEFFGFTPDNKVNSHLFYDIGMYTYILLYLYIYIYRYIAKYIVTNI